MPKRHIFGKRQADYIGRESDSATEFDFHAVLCMP
jgi:hypothetical protein